MIRTDLYKCWIRNFFEGFFTSITSEGNVEILTLWTDYWNCGSNVAFVKFRFAQRRIRYESSSIYSLNFFLFINRHLTVLVCLSRNLSLVELPRGTGPNKTVFRKAVHVLKPASSARSLHVQRYTFKIICMFIIKFN